MALIYLLPQAEEDAKKIGAYYELMQLVKNCKERTFDEADQLFEKRFPYRYRRMGNRRVVAKIALEQGYPVICFLHLFKKGSDQAEEFNLDPRSYGEKWLESLIDPAALAKVVEEGINQSQEFKTKPKMTDVLYNWWSPFEKVIDADDVVMESEGWVRAMEQRDYGDYWQSYHRLVLDAVAGKGSPVQTDSLVHRVRDSDNRSVYYVSFSSNGHGDAENLITITYLLAPFDRKLGQQDDIERTLIETNAWIRSKALSVDSDSVARHSLRGYPAYILADDRIWREIQQDDVANLALSAEEARLLGELRHAPNGTAVLPVFINGRAGSGKSTILYYLFADYYQRKLKEDLDGEIVFLTYGDRLLKAAKDHVAKLLKTRVDFLVEHSDSARDASNMRDIEAEPIFDKCFQPFLRFARSHVPEQEALKQFPDSRFVDFRRFKQLFLNRNLSQEDIAFALHSPHRGLSADVSWHIIRSFIKGFRAGEYLAPDDYADIPQKERSVSIDLYKRVYTEIWEQWYKVLTTEQGFWDAQDLTREILQQGWAEPKYAVVFCDEAQDFTRVEIDFILRLLVYRKFDLGWQPRVRLPFALAGDPFQTLNPSGFRWEAIKASFYDEIVGNLDPEGRGIVEFYYKELSYNYRSEAPIVRLSNIFQLWREVLFKGSDIHPQRPWREDQHIIPPRLFVLGQSITVDQFADLATTSVIIVPCEQGQEEEFIANDEILLAIQKAGKPLTILSPMSAKGLEFRAVVVYKFGQHCPANFFKKMDFESRLENEYYLNKLYVAATRAMHNLVFVDTIEGRERLWNNAVDPEAIAYYLEQAGAPGQWQGHIAGLTMGDLYGLDVEAQDPLEIAMC